MSVSVMASKQGGLPGLTLVLGGARSGKSRHAEGVVMGVAPPWRYVATAQALDGEMRERIVAHRARRGAGWETVEAPVDLAGALVASGPVLVDCLTLWVSNLMHAGLEVEQATAALEACLGAREGGTVLVSNEVGLGIVPENALARRFRDVAGVLHQRLAARADSVVLMVAGIAVVVK